MVPGTPPKSPAFSRLGLGCLGVLVLGILAMGACVVVRAGQIRYDRSELERMLREEVPTARLVSLEELRTQRPSRVVRLEESFQTGNWYALSPGTSPGRHFCFATPGTGGIFLFPERASDPGRKAEALLADGRVHRVTVFVRYPGGLADSADVAQLVDIRPLPSAP